MASERYAVVDVETTGFNSVHDRIVEMACVQVDADRIIGRWTTLVNPGIPIPAQATAIHGITDAHVRKAPALQPALAQLRRLCEGRTIVAHSARFELSFLGRSIATRALCTVRLARVVFPEAPNHKNQTLRTFLAIDAAVGEHLSAHRALADAVVTAHILLACRRRFRASFPSMRWERFLLETDSFAQAAAA
jgi:DNA polymerase III epsilon subunit family exonuclease